MSMSAYVQLHAPARLSRWDELLCLETLKKTGLFTIWLGLSAHVNKATVEFVICRSAISIHQHRGSSAFIMLGYKSLK